MKNGKNIKAIIVDLDRTLLRSDKTISQYTVDVLKRCKQRGIKIFVATARPQRDAMQFCDTLSFDGLVVSFQPCGSPLKPAIALIPIDLLKITQLLFVII